VSLKASTRRSNAALFEGDERRVPPEALSVGMATILQARRIVLIATGKSKARCVDLLRSGPITTKLPASFLQLHRNVTLMLDEAAAGSARERQP
jgi:glucosamine-6-phosphate deaminase